MINIAVCKNRKDKTYQNLQIEFSKLKEMLSKTTYTNETYEEYQNLPKEHKDNIKDVGGFVGGYLIDGRRTKATVKYRNLLTLDVDHGVCGLMDFIDICGDFESLMYTTHKHSSENERFRIVIPLNRNVDNIEYEALGRKVADTIGIDNFDDTTYDPTRLMYFPSTSCDGEFRFIHVEGQTLDVDYYLNKYEDYTDKTSWPVSSRVNKLPNHLDKKQQNPQNPLQKEGMIGAFCKAYNIYEVIENYLEDTYTPTENKDRYTYVNATTSGGLVIYEDGLFAYSHHSSDPCSEKLCNAFDLVKNHKFSTFNEEEKLKKMVELICSDKEVIKQMGRQNLEIAKREFQTCEESNISTNTTDLDKITTNISTDINSSNSNDNIANDINRNSSNSNTNTTKDINSNSNSSITTDTNPNTGNIHTKINNIETNNKDNINTNDSETSDMSWYTTLEVNAKGKLLNTINNIVIILENDNRLKNKIALNKFSHQITLRGNLPWRKLEHVNEIWNDNDDSSLRHYLERVYKIKSKEAIFDAISVVGAKHSYHPIREYLNSLTWDGNERIEHLFIDYLGAKNTDYTREVSRKMLIAAVARIFEPGIKFDYMAVFVGKEGIGKSHLINLLGKNWYTDSINTVLGKEAYEQLQEAWIVEMAELSAVKKAETEAVKHFISKREDMYRVAYGRRVEKFKRQCVFFGTTNEETFLKDRNGNRRFWPVKVGVNKIKKSVFKDLNKNEVDNIWAEALHYYNMGEELILSSEVGKAALMLQQEHLEDSPKEGMIIEYLDKLLPISWDKMDIYARRRYLSEGDFSEFEEGTVIREKVCAMEIWVELFNGDPKMLSPMHSREINDILRKIEGWKTYDQGSGRIRFGKIYGQQRAFVRDEI